jgi:Kef-type K+ transport system membrane component KefB
MTLMDIGKLKTPEGKVVLTAAIIDDVIGIIFLTIILCILGTVTSPWITILKLIGFFVAAYFVGLLFLVAFGWAERLKAREAVLAIAFAMMLIYAFMATRLGVVSITGAYIAGFILKRTKYKRTILSGMDTIGHSIFICFFFVDIGLKTNLIAIGGNYLFLIILLLCAIVGKIGGSFIGTTLTHLKPKRGLKVGVGMVPRGEVALAIASMALSQGLIQRGDFSSVVVMVIASTLIAPLLLKWSFRERA